MWILEGPTKPGVCHTWGGQSFMSPFSLVHLKTGTWESHGCDKLISQPECHYISPVLPWLQIHRVFTVSLSVTAYLKVGYMYYNFGEMERSWPLCWPFLFSISGWCPAVWRLNNGDCHPTASTFSSYRHSARLVYKTGNNSTLCSEYVWNTVFVFLFYQDNNIQSSVFIISEILKPLHCQLS